jgi:hypothetical protein
MEIEKGGYYLIRKKAMFIGDDSVEQVRVDGFSPSGEYVQISYCDGSKTHEWKSKSSFKPIERL